MRSTHPVSYIVKALRNNLVAHVQQAPNLDAAQRLKNRFEAVPGTTAEIVEVHESAETDLTTKTREIVETIATHARS